MILNLKSSTDLSGFYVVFNGSVMNESKGLYGISHLTEHLLCKSFEHLYDEFEQRGIKWNAYTSDRLINFHMTGLDEHINEYKLRFLESLRGFNITEDILANEKKIVLEEYKDSFNTQSESHVLNLMRKKFGHYNPIGLKSDIEDITLDGINEFMRMQYTNPSMIINVSRNNDFDATGVMFNDKNFTNKRLVYGNYDAVIEESNDFKSKCSIINLSKVVDSDIPVVKFIATMLGGGLKSPLYQEIREKRGLVYYISCYFQQVTDRDGVVIIASETSNDNVGLFQDTLNEILSNPSKYMTVERFNTTLMSYDVRFKVADINRYDNITRYILPGDCSLENVIGTLTFEKVMEVYDKYFNFDDYYKSVDKEEFSTK